jgi:hypothetical protein
LVEPARGANFEAIDLAKDSRDNAWQLAQNYMQEFLDYTIDYSVDLLFDAKILKLSEHEYVLVVSADHLITDGVSNEILKSELRTIYECPADERAAALPKVLIQFADYAAWLRMIYPLWKTTHGPYWERRLAAAPITRPVQPGLAAEREWHLEIVKVPTDARLSERLVQFSQATRSRPALVVLAAYVATVAHWWNHTDLTLALVDSARHRAELVPMIGCIATHLHMRVELTSDQTFIDLLDLISRELSEASDNRDFDWIPSLIPEFQPDLYFNWLTATDANQAWIGGGHDRLKVQSVPVSPSTKAVGDLYRLFQGKLGLACTHTVSDLAASMYYRTDYFTSSVVERAARNLRLFLETIMEHPLTRIGSASVDWQ